MLIKPALCATLTGLAGLGVVAGVGTAAAAPPRLDVGDWVETEMPWFEGSSLRQRFTIVGERFDPEGRRLVWLEMSWQGSYPITARILVPAALFDERRVGPVDLERSALDLVGRFGYGSVEHLPGSEAHAKVGGYIPLTSCPDAGQLLGQEEIVTAAGALLTTHRAVPFEDGVTEFWCADEVPLTGLVRMRVRGSLVSTVAFGTGGVSQLPGFGSVSETKAAPSPARPVGEVGFARLAAALDYDRDLPLDVRVVGRLDYDGRKLPYTTEKVTFASTDGETVIGTFVYPRDAADPVPAVLLLHAHNEFRGRHDRWTQGWLDRLPREGWAALAIDQYGFGERLRPRPAADDTAGARAYAVHGVVDARRALDYLAVRPEVDAGRLALMGESMGATTACRVAGLEDRLATVVLVAAAAWPPNSARTPVANLSNPLHFAPRIRAPVLMVNARDDEFATRDEVETLFRALRVSQKLVWRDGGHSIPVEEQEREVIPWLRQRLGGRR